MRIGLSRRTGPRACSPGVRQHFTRLLVEVGNRASAWREAAADAEAAFRGWQNASQPDRPNAAAVYLAAIDREEKAADEYRGAVEACSGATP
jgi:hypothetical protein